MSIRHRLFLLLLLASALVVTSSYTLLRWSFDTGFLHFVEGRKAREAVRLSERLARHTATTPWAPSDEAAWSALIREVGRELRDEDGEERNRPATPAPESRKPAKFALLDAQENVLLGDDPKVDRWVLTPIRTTVGLVGFVGTKPTKWLSEKNDLHFAEGLSQRFALVSALLAMACGALAWWFAGFLTRPIQAIATAVGRLTHGDLDSRVPVSGRDEFASLGRHVNDMASRLQQTDQERQEWLANLAHELRTPLALLRAELEAIEDGVRRADLHGLGNAMGACDRLENLVNDLSAPASGSAMSSHPLDQRVDVAAILRDRASAWSSAFAHRGLALTLDVPTGPLNVAGNRRLLEQVVDNLMGNWVRYTEHGGRCRVTAVRENDRMICGFQDSGPGVDPTLHERVFERFFRVEPSRSREHGGAGLGLSICRQIVQAHGGGIYAAKAALGGLEIRIDLPAGGVT